MSTKRKEKEKEITYHYHKCLRARLNVMTSGMCNDACTAKPKTPLWKIQWDLSTMYLGIAAYLRKLRSRLPVLDSVSTFKWEPERRTWNLPSLECLRCALSYAGIRYPSCPWTREAWTSGIVPIITRTYHTMYDNR